MRHDRKQLASGERVGDAARRLRGRPGWNPRPGRGNDPQALTARLGELRAAAVYEQSAHCAACAAARRQGEPDALCADHLAQALGVAPDRTGDQ